MQQTDNEANLRLNDLGRQRSELRAECRRVINDQRDNEEKLGGVVTDEKAREKYGDKQHAVKQQLRRFFEAAQEKLIRTAHDQINAANALAIPRGTMGSGTGVEGSQPGTPPATQDKGGDKCAERRGIFAKGQRIILGFCGGGAPGWMEM